MNVGLVLSGGMAKGAYQIGVLKALSEYLSPSDVKYVSSASIGSLNSYAFSSGNIDGAVEMWKSVTEYKRKIFLPTLLRGSQIQKAIYNLTVYPLECDKFYVPFFNLKKRENCYIDLSGKNEQEIDDYMSAAVAVFPVCSPVTIESEQLYDGAIIDNIPVYPLLKHRLDYVVCVYFNEYNYVFESHYFDNKVIKITFDDKQFVSKSIWLSEDGINSMISDGYKKAKSIFDFVFISGVDNVERIYDQIEALNSFNPRKKMRLTGDVVVGNINRVVQRVTKRKIIE